MLEEQHAAARRREEAPTPPWVRHARGEAAQRIPTPPWVRRRNLRRQYGAGVLGDDSGGTQDDGFQQAINRAIAGVFSLSVPPCQVQREAACVCLSKLELSEQGILTCRCFHGHRRFRRGE